MTEPPWPEAPEECAVPAVEHLSATTSAGRVG
jgi:hypothetical protein